MQMTEAIEKDLHPPYQILIIFMLMLTASAYSQQKSNAPIDTARIEHHSLLKGPAAPLMTRSASEELQYKTQKTNDNVYPSTVVPDNHITPTLERDYTPRFAD